QPAPECARAFAPPVAGPGWKKNYGLKRSELPLEIPPFEVAMLWHHKRNQDPALLWLLEVVREILDGGHGN
ncbi:MAG: hypothetical protein WCD24_21605, partial [Serratia inhibens]